jgi:hypothetical protein
MSVTKVQSGFIDNNALNSANIASNAVTTNKIADLNVTTNKIADLNVTPAKLSTGGPTWDTTGNLVTDGLFTANRLSIGGNIIIDSSRNITNCNQVQGGVTISGSAFNLSGSSSTTLLTSLPTWTRQIVVNFQNLQMSTSANPYIYFSGTSASYSSVSTYVSGGVSSGQVNSDTTLLLFTSSPLNRITGNVIFTRSIDPSGQFRWHASGTWQYMNAPQIQGWVTGVAYVGTNNITAVTIATTDFTGIIGSAQATYTS